MKDRSDDLNIILIVVSFTTRASPRALTGLLSAMISAFAIYVHPQLQLDPTDESVALLRVILFKMDNTVFGGDVPQHPKWTGPPRTIIATQFLLYISLLCTIAGVFFRNHLQAVIGPLRLRPLTRGASPTWTPVVHREPPHHTFGAIFHSSVRTVDLR